MKFQYGTLFLILAVLGCAHSPLPLSVEAPPDPMSCHTNEHMTLAVLWFQNSAENKALFRQGYGIAKSRLMDILKIRNRFKKPLSIILDIDETVLDNSPYQSSLIKSGKVFPEGWEEWTNSSRANLLPGALEFLKFADSRGVSIFFVTNRRATEKRGTIANLVKQGVPQANESTVIVREDVSSKESRRRKIAAKYEVVLLLGDNLGDFSDVFDKATVSKRESAVSELALQFGSRFIVFPNPMYGDWEAAVYDHNFKRTKEDLCKLRLEALTTPIFEGSEE